jgi:hypothetical protein
MSHNEELFRKKNFKCGLFGLFVLSSILIMGCATTGGTVGNSSMPGLDDSVVVIQRKNTMVGALIPMRVYIDDEYKLSVGSGQTASIIVPNGEHSIWVGSTKIDSSSSLPFMVYSEEITFSAAPKFGIIAADFTLTQTGKRNL